MLRYSLLVQELPQWGSVCQDSNRSENLQFLVDTMTVWGSPLLYERIFEDTCACAAGDHLSQLSPFAGAFRAPLDGASANLDFPSYQRYNLLLTSDTHPQSEWRSCARCRKCSRIESQSTQVRLSRGVLKMCTDAGAKGEAISVLQPCRRGSSGRSFFLKQTTVNTQSSGKSVTVLPFL